MRRHARMTGYIFMLRDDGKVQCEKCNKFATLENAARLKWDWFTGALESTVHFCPQCQIIYKSEIDDLYGIARIKREI